jgi:hypothetical protein
MANARDVRELKLNRHEANVLLRVLARGNHHPDTPNSERHLVAWVVGRIISTFEMDPTT